MADVNFISKVKPSQKYPVNKINAANFIDEDGDPIVNLDVPTSPDPATLTLPSTEAKTNAKQNTGLKQTPFTTVLKKKRFRKQNAAEDVTTP